jgi:hypothetical protein
MIEKRPMKIEDFLLIMEQNAGVYPWYDNLVDEQKRCVANMNIITGTAESFFEDGQLVGVGGIRFAGIGEAWMIVPPDIRDKRKLSLLRETKNTFIRTRDEKNLWRCFAESKISDNFLKHIGFEPNPKGLVWTRT